jgi:hypothetical protein
MISNNIKFILLLNIIFITFTYCKNDDTITTPFKIGENEYMLTYPNSEEGVGLFTAKFCSEKGHEFGITNDNINESCLVPIGKYLIETINKNKNKNIDIANDGNIKEVSTPVISKEMLDKYHVSNIVNKGRALHIEFTINSIIFEVIIGPQDEYFNIARNFCYLNQKDLEVVIPELDQLFPTSINTDLTTCISPIEKQLIHSMSKHKWTNIGNEEPEEESEMDKNYKVVNIVDIGKKLSLDIVIYNVNYNIIIAPHESHFSVAKKFCIKNKNKLEFSSEELNHCINIIEMQIGKAIVKHKYLGNTKGKQHSHENYIHKESESLDKTEEYLKKKYEGNTKEKQQSHSNFISKESREEKKKLKELRKQKIKEKLNQNQNDSGGESSISAKFDIGK